MSNSPTNLDYVAAKTSQEICIEASKKDELENLATKSLGILNEDGVYALFLYLLSKDESDEKLMCQKLISSLKEVKIEVQISDKPDETLKLLKDALLTNLENLMLARQLFERTLTYVRYHAKALKED